MTAKTAERLEKVLSIIDPEHFDMNNWIDAEQQNGARTPLNMLGDDINGVADYLKHREGCGTTACLAGWCAIAFPARGEDRKLSVEAYAIKKLEITGTANSWLWEDFENDRLFYVCNWPNKFVEAYNSAKTGRGRLAALKARVRHFIKTKGAE